MEINRICLDTINFNEFPYISINFKYKYTKMDDDILLTKNSFFTIMLYLQLPILQLHNPSQGGKQ